MQRFCGANGSVKPLGAGCVSRVPAGWHLSRLAPGFVFGRVGPELTGF